MVIQNYYGAYRLPFPRFARVLRTAFSLRSIGEPVHSLLTPILLLKLERCQYWFLKHIFYFQEFAPGPLLLKILVLNSTESEVAIKKLLFLSRLITEHNMTTLIKNLFDSKTKSFFDSDISSLGVLASITKSLEKFDLFYFFETRYNNSIFDTYKNLKNIVRDSIIHFENSAWHSYCNTHPEMQIATSCLANVTPFHFWSLADHFPDLLSGLHLQVRLMSQFGPSGGTLPWLHDPDGAFCFVCKQDIESVTHFLLDCSYFKQYFLSLWRKFKN